MLQTGRNRCDISLKGAVLPQVQWRDGHHQLVTRFGEYNELDEKFGVFFIAVPSCPPPFNPYARVSFQLRCSHGYNIGSRCNVACPKGMFLNGITQIQCLESGNWNTELGTTQCTPDQTCPPGAPVVQCLTSPCKNADCPGVPEAVCVDNFCGGCNFNHYLNGRRISNKDCIPRGKFALNWTVI